MNGLDTNILVRYLVDDDQRQSELVSRIIEAGVEQGETFFISDVVVCELVWVLDSAYQFGKEDILLGLEAVLAGDAFEFANHDRLRRAYISYKEGSGDYADYLIGVFGSENGCDTTLTFDKSLKDHSEFSLL